MFGGIDFFAQCTDDLLHFCEFVFILGQTLANSFQSEVNTSKPALLLAIVICSSVFEEGSESLLQFLELLRGTAFECLQLIFGGSGLCCECSEDFLHFCELVLILQQLLVGLLELKVSTSKSVLLLVMHICEGSLQSRNLSCYLFFQAVLLQFPDICYLVLTDSECLYFFVNKNTESLL